MKLNKGFAPIAIVLIIIAVIALGGVAYFAGKNSNPLPQSVVQNNLPQNNQNDVVNPPVQNNEVSNVATNTEANCLPTTVPWIKVLSPNGGDVFYIGDTMKIKFSSCNVTNVITASNIYLKRYNLSGQEISPWAPLDSQIQSNGTNSYISNFIIPAILQVGSNTINFSNSNVKYKVYIETITKTFSSGTPDYIQDYSDNFFTINAKAVVSNSNCGFVVNSPSANTHVSFPLTVKGTITAQPTGCSWSRFEGQAGSAQLYYQDQGIWNPIGAEMIIHPDNWAAPTTPFTLVVNFNNGGLGLPSGSMMKIVFTNSENASGIPRTYETVTLPIIL